MANKLNVLVVEDDASIRNLITTTLKAHDYKYLSAYNGNSALLEASTHNPDVILLDLGLPDMDGIEVIQKVRKPFSVEELLARLRVTQRRLSFIQNEKMNQDSVFENGQLKIDYVSGCCYLNGEELHLTPIEFKLLTLLSKNIGKVLTHTYITQSIWGSANENDIASLRVFMATLRKKIEKNTNGVQYIQTHIGVGYRMIKI